MSFVPHTHEDIAGMLRVIGAGSVEELFEEIPRELRAGDIREMPVALNEAEVARLMHARARADGHSLCFIGAGAYEHHVPAAVWAIASRGEFYSAYTPYQAEASQGTLQLIYEFQSMIAALTGMDVANASLYDGASALAEGVLMAVRAQRRSQSRRILIPASVHPHWRRVVHAVGANQALELETLPFEPHSGLLRDPARAAGAGEFAALVIQQPNFFGGLEDVDALTDWAHARGALVVAAVNPVSLGILKPPGEWGATGADIVLGEGQPLGVPLAAGGPYFGFMATRSALVRQMPGRIVGRTLDTAGRTGYTLTLQAREQHIRRSKATSNICTNQGLMVTAATVHLALLGAGGLERVACACHARTRELVTALTGIPGVSRAFQGGFFHECALRLPRPAAAVLEPLAQRGIEGGFDLLEDYPELGPSLLVCATELRSSEDIEHYAQALREVLNAGGGR